MLFVATFHRRVKNEFHNFFNFLIIDNDNLALGPGFRTDSKGFMIAPGDLQQGWFCRVGFIAKLSNLFCHLLKLDGAIRPRVVVECYVITSLRYLFAFFQHHFFHNHSWRRRFFRNGNHGGHHDFTHTQRWLQT